MNRALALGRALDSSLDRACGLARALDVALDRAYAHELGHELGRAYAIARDLDRELGLDLVHDLHLTGARGLARGLALDLDHDLTRARDLALARNRDVVDRDRARARDLAHALETACVLARRLILILEPAVQSEVAATVTSTRVAAQLAHGAVRVLPVGQRGRYRDEFDSELYELAAAGASRWAQLIYGLRLIDRAWVLRAELRDAEALGKAARP